MEARAVVLPGHRATQSLFTWLAQCVGVNIWYWFKAGLLTDWSRAKEERNISEILQNGIVITFIF